MKVEIILNDKQQKIVDKMLMSGLYGKTENEVVEELINMQMREFICSGLMFKLEGF